MRKYDKLVYAIHKWCGLIGGIFILFLSITGTLLIFREEIDLATNGALLTVSPQGQRLPFDQVLSNIRQQYPDATLNGTFLYTTTPDRSVMTEIVQDKTRLWVYANPYTGELLGKRVRSEVFIVQLLMWHEHLTVGDTGHLILFLVGVCFVASVVSGLWYYRRSLLSVFKVGVRNKNAYLLNADLHKLVGVSAALFLFLMACTGTFMHWEKVERMLGEENPKSQLPAKSAQQSTQAEEIGYSTDSLIAVATTQIAGFVPQYVGFPRQAGEPLLVRGTRPESVRLLGKFNSTVSLDVHTGKVTEISHKEDKDLEANLESAAEQLHFGDYGGWFTKILYGLGGMGLGVLTITGFLIWFKKK